VRDEEPWKGSALLVHANDAPRKKATPSHMPGPQAEKANGRRG
jgi:hypothetical protein